MNFTGMIFLPFVVLALGGGGHPVGPSTDKEFIGVFLFILVVLAVITRVFGKKD
jgi:hypothetical protein